MGGLYLLFDHMGEAESTPSFQLLTLMGFRELTTCRGLAIRASESDDAHKCSNTFPTPRGISIGKHPVTRSLGPCLGAALELPPYFRFQAGTLV